MTDKQGDILLGISRNMEKILTSIEKNTSRSGEGSDGISKSSIAGSLGVGMSSLASSVSKFDKRKGQAFISFTSEMADIVESINDSKVKSFGEFTGAISDAINTVIDIVNPGKLIKLVIGSKILFGGKNPILKTILGGISDSFSDFDHKKVKNGSEALGELSKGLSIMSSAMLKIALIGVAAPLVAVGTLVLWGLIKLFNNIGKHAKDYSKGGKALEHLGKGLVLFSAGLASFMLVLLIVKPAGILMGIAVLAAFAITFTLIGKASNLIESGGKSIAWMGLGLFAFSAALATYMLVMLLATPKLVLEGAAFLVFLGGTFALLGKFSTSIKDGGKAMTEMGLGLIAVSGGILAFGIAIKLLQLIFKDNLVQAGMIAGGILLGLGGAFAIIGLLNKSGALQSGADGMQKIGVALLTISGSILVFGIAIRLLQSIFKDNLSQAGIIAGGILIGLALASMIFAIPLVAAGAASMLTVGFGLMAISGGILLFGLAIKALQNIFKDDLEQAGIVAGKILIGLGLAFAAIGVVSLLIVPGAAAGITMGLALLSISLGVWTFGNTIKGLYDKGLIDQDGNMKGVGIISQMMSEFASMFFTSVLAIPGIIASIGMGVSLMVIAKGLDDVSKVISKLDPNVLISTLFDEDKGIIYELARNFKRIGSEFSGGFLSNWLGTDDISLGVKTVRGFGEVLQEIAGGIVAFSDFTSFPIKKVKGGKLVDGTVNLFDTIPIISENVPILLTSLSSIFADIGAKYGEGFWTDSPVQKGIDAVKGIGSVLSELAGGIVAFANFENYPIKKMDNGKLVDGTVNLFNIIPNIYNALIGNGKVTSDVTPKTGILFALANIFAKIGEEYGEGFFTDSKVQKGVDAVKGIGGVLSEIANGIVSFTQLDRGLPEYDKSGNLVKYGPPISPAKIKESITSFMKIIPSVFADLEPKDFDKAKSITDSMSPIAELISDFGGSFKELFIEKKKDQFNILDTLGKSIAQFSTDLSSVNILDKDKMTQLTTFVNLIEKLSDTGSGLKDAASGLSSLGKGFSSFGTGFNKFSISLSKFERFETSMSSLITNQNRYNFDKFADSMGILQKNVNSFDVEKLKLTDSMMRSIAAISKTPDTLADKISETLEKSFEELVTAIKNLARESTQDEAVTNIVNPATSNPLQGIVNKTSKGSSENEASSAKLEGMIDLLTTSLTGISKHLSSINGKIIMSKDGIKVDTAI